MRKDTASIDILKRVLNCDKNVMQPYQNDQWTSHTNKEEKTIQQVQTGDED